MPFVAYVHAHEPDLRRPACAVGAELAVWRWVGVAAWPGYASAHTAAPRRPC